MLAARVPAPRSTVRRDRRCRSTASGSSTSAGCWPARSRLCCSPTSAPTSSRSSRRRATRRAPGGRRGGATRPIGGAPTSRRSTATSAASSSTCAPMTVAPPRPAPGDGRSARPQLPTVNRRAARARGRCAARAPPAAGRRQRRRLHRRRCRPAGLRPACAGRLGPRCPSPASGWAADEGRRRPARPHRRARMRGRSPRRAHGRGERAATMNVSLIEAGVSSLINVLGGYLASGRGAAAPRKRPPEYRAIRVVRGARWAPGGRRRQRRPVRPARRRPRTCRSQGPVRDEPTRVARRAELTPWLAARIATWDRTALVDALVQADVPAGPVNSIADALGVRGAHWIQTIDGIGVTPSPIRLEGAVVMPRLPPPPWRAHRQCPW